MEPTAARDGGGVHPSDSLPRRVVRAWLVLPGEQRLAAIGAVCLLFSLVLPWYEATSQGCGVVKGKEICASVSNAHSAISVFTFVEAAIMVTALAVLFLLFARAERRAFHLPGGDGAVITAAGAWALLLVIWRFFDKPDLGKGVTSGLHWGILGPLAAAGLLLYAGQRMRIAHRPEPPLPSAVADAAPSRHNRRETEATEVVTRGPAPVTEAARDAARSVSRRRRPDPPPARPLPEEDATQASLFPEDSGLPLRPAPHPARPPSATRRPRRLTRRVALRNPVR